MGGLLLAYPWVGDFNIHVYTYIYIYMYMGIGFTITLMGGSYSISCSVYGCTYRGAHTALYYITALWVGVGLNFMV